MSGNKINIAGISYGPDRTLYGKDRHDTVLAQLFLKNQCVLGPPELLVAFFFETAGKFRPEVKEGMQRRSWRDGSLLSVDVGIPFRVLSCTDADYQRYLAAQVLAGSRSLVEFARKKKVDIDSTAFLSVVCLTVSEYLQVDFDLVDGSPSQIVLEKFFESKNAR